MKKLVYMSLVLFSIMLTSSILKSCKVQNKLYSEKELKPENFTTQEWCILKDGTVVAELESVDSKIEINNNKFIGNNVSK